MKIYTCTAFTGRQPTGTAAIVLAESRVEAKAILKKELKEQQLDGSDLKASDLHEVYDSTDHYANKRAIVLCDGDY